MTTKIAGGKITGILALTFEAQEALEVGDPVSVTGDYEVNKCDGTRPFIGIVSVANKGRAADGAYPSDKVPGDCTVEVPGFYVRTGTAGAAIPAGVDVGFDSAGELVPMGSATATGEVNEVQTVTVDATGGTFTLTFAGDTTTAIPEASAASVVQAALEALDSIGTGNVTVSGSAGGPFTITFVGELAGRDNPPITSDPALLTGGAGTATVAQTTAGVTGIAIAKAGTSLMAAADGAPVDFLVR